MKLDLKNSRIMTWWNRRNSPKSDDSPDEAPEKTDETGKKGFITDFARQCAENLEEFEEVEVKCGITGPSGSGKSSLINAIVNERIADVGVTETTNEPQDVRHGNVIFTDLPGIGTAKWPRETYIERLDLASYDVFLLITSGRFTENDLFLYQKLTEMGKPCLVVRNKFDIAVTNADFDHGHTEEQTREIITRNILENLAPSRPERIYLVSARLPHLYDLDDLLSDIQEALPGIKSQRFLMDSAAYSAKKLSEKRELLEKRLIWYTGTAAANGAIPIPGIDVFGDVAVMLKFADEVASSYGLNEDQLGRKQRFLTSNTGQTLVTKAAQFTASFLTKQGIKVLLKKTANKTVARQAGKLVPILGPAVGAVIGGSGTYLVGRQMISEGETIAREIMEEMSRSATLESLTEKTT